jgi:four helix bundle protein
MTEAGSASSKKDYINFYSYALKCANETVYWLSLLKELIPNLRIVNRLSTEARRVL